MQASSACVLGLVTCQDLCIDGRAVSTSDSESVGPGSIPGGLILNFFTLFRFLILEVITFFYVFSLYFKVERYIKINQKSYSIPYKRNEQFSAIFLYQDPLHFCGPSVNY